MNLKSTEIKLEIIKFAKKLYDRQMVNRNEGNVSIRHQMKYILHPLRCKDNY